MGHDVVVVNPNPASSLSLLFYLSVGKWCLVIVLASSGGSSKASPLLVPLKKCCPVAALPALMLQSTPGSCGPTGECVQVGVSCSCAGGVEAGLGEGVMEISRELTVEQQSGLYLCTGAPLWVLLLSILITLHKMSS